MNKQQAQPVKVIGQGTLAGNGMPFLLVTSGSEPGRVHVCVYSYSGAFVGSRMQCDCVAASYGKSCRHVLVARAWLADVPGVSPAVSHGTKKPTPRPQSMLNRTQPFSLMK